MHDDDKRALAQISILYAAVTILIALLLSGCAVTIKQGGTPPVDPLTRKYYPTLEANP
jgi:hypothetical protein